MLSSCGSQLVAKWIRRLTSDQKISGSSPGGVILFKLKSFILFEIIAYNPCEINNNLLTSLEMKNSRNFSYFFSLSFSATCTCSHFKITWNDVEYWTTLKANCDSVDQC